MKIFKNYITHKVLVLFSILLIVGIMPSCEKYLDVNEDPDALYSNPGVYLLPSIQISIGSIIGGKFALHGSLWCQYYNQSNTANQYRDEIDMLIKAEDGDVMWDELYASALSDIQMLKAYANAEETYNPRLNLIAVALESYTFQIIYDAFGQAPYKEAFEGESDRSFNPHFQKGEEVYPMLVDSINAAIEEYNTYLSKNPGLSPNLSEAEADKDFMYIGVMSDWFRFANSVKLKLAMRNFDYDSAWSIGVIDTLEQIGQYITSDAMLDIFSSERNKENPLYAQDQNLNTKVNLIANRTLSEFWAKNNDPREAITFVKNQSGDHLVDHGDHKISSSLVPQNSARKPILSATRPVYLLTTSEVNFFRAELAVKGHITVDAKTLYDEAVREAFARVGASSVTADTSHLGTNMNYEFSSTADSQMVDIGVQKWAALANVNPFEAFLEIHRLDYPEILQQKDYLPEDSIPSGNAAAKLYLPKNTVLGTDYIKRYLLPESELFSNANFPGQTKVTDKLWWDTK